MRQTTPSMEAISPERCSDSLWVYQNGKGDRPAPLDALQSRAAAPSSTFQVLHIRAELCPKLLPLVDSSPHRVLGAAGGGSQGDTRPFWLLHQRVGSLLFSLMEGSTQ